MFFPKRRPHQLLAIDDFQRREGGKIVYAGNDAIELQMDGTSCRVAHAFHAMGTPKWKAHIAPTPSSISLSALVKQQQQPLAVKTIAPGSVCRQSDPGDPLTQLLDVEFESLREARAAVETLTSLKAHYHSLRPQYVAQREQPGKIGLRAQMWRTDNHWCWSLHHANRRSMVPQTGTAATRRQALESINYQLYPVAGLASIIRRRGEKNAVA